MPDGPYGHISVADRPGIIAAFPPHEREARSKGIPKLGSGRIYTTDDQHIVENVNPLSFPVWYRWIWGIDLGIAHPFAAVLLAWDSESGQDVIHLVAEVCVSDGTISTHVHEIKATERRIFGKYLDIPVAWPHDAGQRDRQDGRPFRELYKQWGLPMLSEPATLPKLTGREAYSVEGGVAEIILREQSGRWKVSAGMLNYLRERSTYHRREGIINAIRNDVLDAARYAYVMRRFAKSMDECGGAVPGTATFSMWSRQEEHRRGPQFAKGSFNHPDGEYDVFTGRKRG